jgi:tetratricopeptide (TPR) repeat protein
LVARGEKEKALNLYRLLSHSFEERAYVLQLEGDILWAFEDQEAVERYKQAAFLYKKEQKIVSSVAVYEHLLTLDPKNYEYLGHTLVLYAQLRWPEKLKQHLGFLISLFNNEEISLEQIKEIINSVMAVSGKDLAGEVKALIKRRAPEVAKQVSKV